MNKVILVGRLGADPEVTYSDRGNAKARLSLATSEHFTDREGNKKESTQWHRVIVWGKLAEACGRFLAKGRQLCVEGRVEYRSYDDKQGQKRWVTEITAGTIEFLGDGKRSEGAHDDGAHDQGQGTDTQPQDDSAGNVAGGGGEGGRAPGEDDIPF